MMTYIILTNPYAALLSSSVVTSATYANTMLNVTENTPEMDSMAKYHLKHDKHDAECHREYTGDGQYGKVPPET